MKRSQYSNVLICCSCPCIVVMLLLFSSCAGTTQTHTTASVPTLTTEVQTYVWKRGVNPETGVSEMQLINETQKMTQLRMTENNVFVPPRPPNAHTKTGHAAGKTDWGFHAVCFLIIGVSYLIITLE